MWINLNKENYQLKQNEVSKTKLCYLMIFIHYIIDYSSDIAGQANKLPILITHSNELNIISYKKIISI